MFLHCNPCSISAGGALYWPLWLYGCQLTQVGVLLAGYVYVKPSGEIRDCDWWRAVSILYSPVEGRACLRERCHIFYQIKTYTKTAFNGCNYKRPQKFKLNHNANAVQLCGQQYKLIFPNFIELVISFQQNWGNINIHAICNIKQNYTNYLPLS